MEILSNSLLRQARRNRRLTLKQVADSVGISDSTMWKYENGQLPLTVERLLQILNLYRCSIAD
ncbi:MAG: helix-turn-helix transcriptional regulator, partial [Selenomonadaceae bacterium]|nr:helix-turn-helix transcriptional regulator [Selenomonadaceae bacterium]